MKVRSWGAPLIMGREDQGLRRLADLLESQRFFSDLRLSPSSAPSRGVGGC